MNVTTPYHFSDCIQGMGCLFWSDFQTEVLEEFKAANKKNEGDAQSMNDHLVQFLI